MGSPWREREVRGSELTVSSSSSQGRAQVVSCRPVLVLVEKELSFWPMRIEAATAAKGRRGSPGRERAGEGIPPFLSGSMSGPLLDHTYRASQLKAKEGQGVAVYDKALS